MDFKSLATVVLMSESFVEGIEVGEVEVEVFVKVDNDIPFLLGWYGLYTYNEKIPHIVLNN